MRVPAVEAAPAAGFVYLSRVTHTRTLCLFLASACLAGCSGDDGDETTPTGPCDPASSACSYAHEFPSMTIAAGEERETQCQSWTLHNPTELWVNTVDFGAGAGWHHSNWFYVPDDVYPMEDGIWDCGEANFDELTAALSGGFLFAQSTQSTEESQVFAPGAAIRIAPYSRVVASIHLLNATGAEVTTASSATIHSIPATDVQVKLTPFRMTYHDLHIPEMAQSEFSGSCDLATPYAALIGEPMQFRLHHLLSHYHTLGTNFRMALTGGDRDGEIIHERSGSAGSDTFGITFDPPLELADMGGLRFTCGYQNMRNVEVGWGIGDQEMCVVAGFAETRMAFDAIVADGTGEMMGMNGAVIEHEGPCSVRAFPWNHDQEGGVGP
jgi:hypothetical protein